MILFKFFFHRFFFIFFYFYSSFDYWINEWIVSLMSSLLIVSFINGGYAFVFNGTICSLQGHIDILLVLHEIEIISNKQNDFYLVVFQRWMIVIVAGHIVQHILCLCSFSNCKLFTKTQINVLFVIIFIAHKLYFRTIFKIYCYFLKILHTTELKSNFNLIWCSFSLFEHKFCSSLIVAKTFLLWKTLKITKSIALKSQFKCAHNKFYSKLSLI